MDSPCINVCALDEQDICVACFRTAQEITDWTILDEDKQRDVVKLANQRRKEHFGANML